MKNIVLCGFMGSGKSTVGKRLAALTNRDFVDMDCYIQDKANMSIPDIFSKYGEPHFRNLEQEAVAELSECKNLVIATGGGALLSDKNISLLKAGGIIVFLDITLETALKRLENSTERPLIDKGNKTEQIKKLYTARLDLYKAAADITVDANPDPNTVAFEIARALNLI